MEPIVPQPFDTGSFHGLTPSLLHDLLKLTFISDEKLSTNPLFPKPDISTLKQEAVDIQKKSDEAEEERLTMAELERNLDQDIARYLLFFVFGVVFNPDNVLRSSLLE